MLNNCALSPNNSGQMAKISGAKKNGYSLGELSEKDSVCLLARLANKNTN